MAVPGGREMVIVSPKDRLESSVWGCLVCRYVWSIGKVVLSGVVLFCSAGRERAVQGQRLLLGWSSGWLMKESFQDCQGLTRGGSWSGRGDP